LRHNDFAVNFSPAQFSPGETTVADDNTIEREEKLAGKLDHLFPQLPKNLAFSECGQHMWFLDASSKAFVGLHNDNNGTWIDLRSAAASNYPEIALCVPRDGGKVVLQVSDGKDSPIQVDVMKAAWLLKQLLPPGADVTT
jgi:hypothetical protein